MNPWTRIAGYAGLAPVVHDFYERILLDPTLAPYFVGVDTGALVDHQVRFLGAAIGGPNEYHGRSLSEAHRGLAIDQEAFEAVAALLRETLEDHGWPDQEVDAVLTSIGSLAGQIIEAAPVGPAESQEGP